MELTSLKPGEHGIISSIGGFDLAIRKKDAKNIILLT